MGERILVAGGRDPFLDGLVHELRTRGFAVVFGDELTHVTAAAPACDAALAVGPNAIALCWHLTRFARHAPVVVLDSTPHAARAAQALRAGAADYVVAPNDADVIAASLARVTEEQAFRSRLSTLDALETDSDTPEPTLLGESPAIRRVMARLARLATSDATVLITGESGTGKEVVARLLHQAGPRSTGPFVAVSCAALPSNLVESELFGHTRGAFTNAAKARPGLLLEATGGSLFLDEVASMPPATQAKLLRAIQQRTVRALGQAEEVSFDARIIAAGNVDLETEVARGRFRADLYFRLNVVQVRMPPLRERALDSLIFAQHFIKRFARESGKAVVGMTESAARAILAYGWPGNVRELQNRIEAAVALTRFDRVTERELGLGPVEPQTHVSGIATPDLSSWSTLELRHIADVLERAGGNKAHAARLLGIDRKTLYRKLRRCGAEAPPAATDKRSTANGARR